MEKFPPLSSVVRAYALGELVPVERLLIHCLSCLTSGIYITDRLNRKCGGPVAAT
ncbi:hypothetical protein WSS15_30290 [Acetobacter pasteurianus]|nr:hypothetical protein WSS15_30290 [Acetobacter pasteurianus]